jgi:shikimate dehydrogenase
MCVEMSDLGRIDGKTKLIGFLANPASHSKSPAIHNAAFRKLGLNYAFLAFEVGNEKLADALTGIRALDVKGFSVSMPNKIDIVPLLDGLSPAAELIGAVNTVVNHNGKFIGHNTDGIGFMRSLDEAGIEYSGKKMTIFGAGGAATAITIQAALEGVTEISIFNRQDQFLPQAHKNAEIIKEKMKDTNCIARVYLLEDLKRLKEEIASSQIITNATDVGMKHLEGMSLLPDSSWICSRQVVTDIIYHPSKTKLLEQAEAAGCKTNNGSGMLLWQGAEQFGIWTGREMPVDYVKEQIFETAAI